MFALNLEFLHSRNILKLKGLFKKKNICGQHQLTLFNINYSAVTIPLSLFTSHDVYIGRAAVATG